MSLRRFIPRPLGALLTHFGLGLIWLLHFLPLPLLAPLTAELIADAATGEPLPDWVALADPRRFARVPA